MIGAAWVAASVVLGAPGDYDVAIAHVGEGRYADALAEAETIADPLLRAQALVYANFSGRDYAAALVAAEDGLAVPETGDDPSARLWLADRAVAAALYFEASERALRWLDWLAARVATLDDASVQDAWAGAVDAHRAALVAIDERALARTQAVDRARWTALSIAIVAFVAGAILVRPTRT